MSVVKIFHIGFLEDSVVVEQYTMTLDSESVEFFCTVVVAVSEPIV